MKNKFALITLLGLFFVGNNGLAQDSSNATVEEEYAVEQTATNGTEEESISTQEESASFHQIIKQKFIEGGPGFMGIVLLCLICLKMFE